MPITNPTIQSWLDEFEEETGIEITVEYVNYLSLPTRPRYWLMRSSLPYSRPPWQ